MSCLVQTPLQALHNEGVYNLAVGPGFHRGHRTPYCNQTHRKWYHHPHFLPFRPLNPWIKIPSHTILVAYVMLLLLCNHAKHLFRDGKSTHLPYLSSSIDKVCKIRLWLKYWLHWLTQAKVKTQALKCSSRKKHPTLSLSLFKGLFWLLFLVKEADFCLQYVKWIIVTTCNNYFTWLLVFLKKNLVLSHPCWNWSWFWEATPYHHDNSKCRGKGSREYIYFCLNVG